jgi:hypothetical protein
VKDPRYKAVKSLIETGNIQGFEELFTIIPISTVKDDLKINYNTLRSHISNPALITLKEISLLADVLEVSPLQVFNLALNDLKKNKRSPAKKSR